MEQKEAKKPNGKTASTDETVRRKNLSTNYLSLEHQEMPEQSTQVSALTWTKREVWSTVLYLSRFLSLDQFSSINFHSTTTNENNKER